MKNFMSGCALLLSLVALPALAAVTVVECVDADGTSSFRDKCPPGTTKTGDKKLTGVTPNKAKTAAEVAATNPVFLYTVPNCDACDLVRNALSTRGIPVTEKNVEDNSANQDELKAKAGSLTVPSVIVGATVLSGYNRSALDNALTQAGYPLPEAAGALKR
jgi:glutaredoxin